MISLTLPWPPSVNSYWRHPTKGRLAGRHLISAEGRSYRQAVTRAARLLGIRGPLPGRLKAELLACVPDRRRRDLDNVLKASLDALRWANVIIDDSQIDDLHIKRGPITHGGELRVEISQVGSTET